MLATVQNLASSRLLSKNVKIKIYRTTTLHDILCGCETWSLTLREVHRLTAFENRVLRRIFGLKRDEVEGSWRKLHNEELNFMPNINRKIKSRRVRWAKYVACEAGCIHHFGGKFRRDLLEYLGVSGGGEDDIEIDYVARNSVICKGRFVF
jgi:hypothetical protein